jgi:hypothetical protein
LGLVELIGEDTRRMAALVRQYRNFRLGAVDAAMVATGNAWRRFGAVMVRRPGHTAMTDPYLRAATERSG